MAIIFHITPRSQYEAAKVLGTYSHSSLAKEGFIHCSRHYQVCEVANARFLGESNLVLLAIAEDKCIHEIKYEGPTWNTFPHIYGVLNLDAVVEVFDFKKTEGRYVLPAKALDVAVETLAQVSTGPLYKDSRHYDAMNGSTGSDVDFYIMEAKKKGGAVLELACGSGRFAIPIAKSGLSVTGLDLSKTMLQLAKEKSKAQNVLCNFVLGDIRLFDLSKKFDFIFCGFNSSQHLHEVKEYESFLECVQSHLEPGGTFALDVFNPSIAMLNRKPTEKFLVSRYNDPDDGQEIEVWEYPSYDAAKQLSSFLFHYLKQGKVLFEERFSLRNYFPLEIDLILRNAGFEIEEKYGGYRGEPFRATSMKQVFLCRSTRA